jgi:hypothetical protein
MVSSRVVRGVLVGAAFGAAFAACAKGNQLGLGGSGAGGGVTTITGSGGGAGGTDSGPPGGGIGSPCPDGSCATGTCTLVGDTKYCTTACPPTCPTGTYCSIISGNPICVPDLGQQCAKCTAATDCKLPSDNCLTAPLGDTFCAEDCSVDGMCPNGFVCEAIGPYESDGGGAGGGGAGGGDGGTVPSAPNRWCVPDGGASCPCNMARDGVVNDCSTPNTNGQCTGTETCNGSTATWGACMCTGEVCNPGYTQFPPGSTGTGCNCQVDADEPNDVCAMATMAGSVQASGGSPLILQGTLSSATDVDVYAFNTVDDTLTVNNAYHVSISFVAPAANTEFVMDVIRGATCSDAPVGNSTDITSYDWCVDGTAAGPIGESPCGPSTANVPHCTNHGSQYFLRVHRAASATATCTQYQISVSGGGGTCDFTQTCP